MGAQHTLPSSPGLTGRSSTLRTLVLITDALEYWIPAFAGMTIAFETATACTTEL
jgi:hypothetical protein